MQRRTLLSLAAALTAAPLPGRSQQPARLLLVHGRAQQGRDPAVIKAEWVDALARGADAIGRRLPSSLEVDLPFYGDTLDRYATAASLPLSADVQARGATPDDAFLAFQAEFAEQVRVKAGVTQAQVDAEYGNDPRARGPLNWAWVQAILRAVDQHGGSAGQGALEAFTRDVFLYITRAGVRDEIDRIVAASLTQQPTVVVAHSLGSVVAYSVLRKETRALQVPLLVTVGSPLGVRAVRDRLRPLRSLPVTAWYNAFDVRDVVALYPLDSESFPVDPAVKNYDLVRNATPNRHGITGYLDDRDVARHVLGGLSP